MIMHSPAFIMGNYDTGFMENLLKDLERNGKPI